MVRVVQVAPFGDSEQAFDPRLVLDTSTYAIIFIHYYYYYYFPLCSLCGVHSSLFNPMLKTCWSICLHYMIREAYFASVLNLCTNTPSHTHKDHGIIDTIHMDRKLPTMCGGSCILHQKLHHQSSHGSITSWITCIKFSSDDGRV